MVKKYQTIKIWAVTLSKLRLLAALKESPMVNVVDNLVKNELKKVQGDKK